MMKKVHVLFFHHFIVFNNGRLCLLVDPVLQYTNIRINRMQLLIIMIRTYLTVKARC